MKHDWPILSFPHEFPFTSHPPPLPSTSTYWQARNNSFQRFKGEKCVRIILNWEKYLYQCNFSVNWENYQFLYQHRLHQPKSWKPSTFRYTVWEVLIMPKLLLSQMEKLRFRRKPVSGRMGPRTQVFWPSAQSSPHYISFLGSSIPWTKPHIPKGKEPCRPQTTYRNSIDVTVVCTQHAPQIMFMSQNSSGPLFQPESSLQCPHLVSLLTADRQDCHTQPGASPKF